MNIGIDTRPLSYELTGIGVYLKNLLDAIQRIDHENRYYLISNGPINYDLENAKWFKLEGRCKRKLLSTFWMQVRMPILASKLKLDLFWGSRHHLPLLLPQKVKAVLTIHDIVHLLYPKTMPLSHLFAERLLMRWSVLRADKIIAVSRSTASGIQEVYRAGSDKIKTVYSGVPILTKSTIVDNNTNTGLPAKYFLFVGTLEPRKNFERILSAFELVKPENHALHLFIAGGSGWKNKAFLETLKNHPLNRHIHLKGYVDSNQLVTFYTKALCLLFPSLHEGFGFPILEAMACGTPVITSNISSMREVAGEAALLVNPYDVRGLANAMNEVLTNKKLRECLVKKGLERVKEFSWERCARDTLDVLNRVGSR